MKNLIKKTIRTMVVASLAVLAIGTTVFASDKSVCTDASGNVFGAGQNLDVLLETSGKVENELFAAGMDVSAIGVDVDGSAFIAGQSVTVKDSEVGGSIFAAGNSVVIDSEANNNIWAAGNSISLGKNTEVKGLHVAGNAITVNGKYEAVSIAGATVTFNAVVDGDVEIEADKVIFGDDAKVSGNLKVTAKENPDAEGVVKGTYEFEEATSDSEEEDADSDEVKENAGKVAGKAAFGLIVLKKIKSAIFNMLKFAVLALVLYFVFKKNLSDSYEYATKKPGAFWGFGALIFVCFPIMAIILCCTIIGIPVALLASAFYFMALFVARVFTFASLGRELIFSHTKKRLHPLAETVLAVLPAAIIKVIPVIGTLVGIACAIYMIGYVSLAFAKSVSSKEQPADAE